VGSLLAATMPEMVERIAFIDMLGPLASDQDSVSVLHTALKERNKIVSRQPQIYPNKSAAMQRYRRNNPFISEQGAQILLERGTLPVVSSEGKVGVKFVHDPRLVGSSPMRMRESDALCFLHAIKCPVMLIFATSSALQYKNLATAESKLKFQKRAKAVQDLEIMEVDGSHHVHLDSPELFAQRLLDFLLCPVSDANPDVQGLLVAKL